MAIQFAAPAVGARFSVYCGAGVYVTGVTNQKKYDDVVVTGGIADALTASRCVAMSALNTARRAGVKCWIVPRPDNMQRGRMVGAML